MVVRTMRLIIPHGWHGCITNGKPHTTPCTCCSFLNLLTCQSKTKPHHCPGRDGGCVSFSAWIWETGRLFKELILRKTLLLYKEEKLSLGCSPCSTESSVMKDAPQGAEKLISFLLIQPLGPYSPAAEYPQAKVTSVRGYLLLRAQWRTAFLPIAAFGQDSLSQQQNGN